MTQANANTNFEQPMEPTSLDSSWSTAGRLLITPLAAAGATAGALVAAAIPYGIFKGAQGMMTRPFWSWAAKWGGGVATVANVVTLGAGIVMRDRAGSDYMTGSSAAALAASGVAAAGGVLLLGSSVPVILGGALVGTVASTTLEYVSTDYSKMVVSLGKSINGVFDGTSTAATVQASPAAASANAAQQSVGTIEPVVQASLPNHKPQTPERAVAA